MKKLFAILLGLFALLSCANRPSADDTLALAHASIAAGDTIAARNACADLADSTKYQLTPSQLCRQAIAYARLRELCDNPDDMASAAKCYAKALQISPDSVIAFFKTLSVSDIATLRMIRYVNQAMEAPHTNTFIPDDEAWADSTLIVSNSPF